jgi:hypothetical protein
VTVNELSVAVHVIGVALLNAKVITLTELAVAPDILAIAGESSTVAVHVGRDVNDAEKLTVYVPAAEREHELIFLASYTPLTAHEPTPDRAPNETADPVGHPVPF